MNKICLSLILMIALVGCDREQNTNPVLGVLIPLSLNGVTTKTPVKLDTTSVGVYVLQTDAVPESTLLNTTFSNMLYKVNAVGSFTGTSVTKLNNTCKYTVMGYAPYKNVTNVYAVPFTAEDVLYAPAAPVVFKVDTATASLSFVHKMSRISFVIVPGLHNPDIKGATLSVTGFFSSCTMNLVNGTITPIMGTGLVITQTDKFFNIVPGNLSLTFTVTVGNRVYKSTATYPAEEGKSCLYTLKVNEGSSTELGVQIKLVDWNVIDAGELPTKN